VFSWVNATPGATDGNADTLDDLIIRSFQKRLTAREAEALSAWRAQAPANEQRYKAWAELWKVTGAAERPFDSVPPSAADIVACARLPAAGSAPQSGWRISGAVALAAGIVLGLLIADMRPGSSAAAGPALAADEFVTGTGELVTVSLSDGTVVRVAPSTRLRITRRPDRREVWLDGKAFFAVKSDPSLPFAVRTRAGEALVRGTRFEADVRAADLRVIVVEGRVDVEAGNQRVQVHAGEVAHASAEQGAYLADPVDIGPLLSWVGDFLVFESTPLHQVAREIEDRYGVAVEIPDSALAQRTITAWFGDQDVEYVLNIICRIAAAHCSILGDTASIEP
jgi:transmembrane sensor